MATKKTTKKPEGSSDTPKLSRSALEFFRAAGKRGGETRAKNISAVKRKKIARKAARARWGS
jgi:hypothetical protein